MKTLISLITPRIGACEHVTALDCLDHNTGYFLLALCVIVFIWRRVGR